MKIPPPGRNDISTAQGKKLWTEVRSHHLLLSLKGKKAKNLTSRYQKMARVY